MPIRVRAPHAYQSEGAAFLARIGGRGNVHLEVGLGKTLIAMLYVLQNDLDDFLVVSPRLVALNTWAQQTGIDGFSVLTGLEESKRALHLALRGRITVVHFEQVAWLMEQLRGRWPFKGVIFDESTRLKGYRTRQGTQLPRLLAPHAHQEIKHWINLSASMFSNRLQAIWGQQWFVDGGARLGRSYAAFESRWFRLARRGDNAPMEPLPGAAEEIAELIKPVTFTADAKDYFDLMQPIERTYTFQLPALVRAQYQQMKRQFQMELEGRTINAVNAGAKADKLRQLASGAVYASVDDSSDYVIAHNERVELLQTLVSELGSTPLLVVYRWRHERERLLATFLEAREARMPGALEAWNAKRLPMLLIHAASAGHGLSLQHGGHHLCFFSPYSDADLAGQVLGRIGPVRQAQSGYHRAVHVYHLEAADTIDQWTRSIREGRFTELGAFNQMLRT